jgi:hypothetical protein
MCVRFALVALLATLAGSAGAQAPIVLADGRSSESGTDAADWAARAPVRRATEAARTYWRAQDAGYEEDVRFFAVAEGAFTAPGARQQAVLYMMSPWPRCCPKMGLAVVEGDRLVRNVAFEHTAQTLTAAPDLDGDGRDELVSTGEFGMGGQVSRSMTVMAFEDGGLSDWGGTGIFDSACAAGPGDGGSMAARVLAVPGPAFTIERYVQPTCESTAWEADGGAEPLTLDPPYDVRYVELAPSSGPPPTAGGATGDRREQGHLAAGDQTLASGEFFDEYAVEGERGQPLVLDLRSTDFDPYLILALPNGEQLDNDDHEGDRDRSLISTTLPATGAYRVLVTSYAAGETGAYELTVRVGGNSH